MPGLTCLFSMMNPTLQIGLVGDYNVNVPAHRAIPLAFSLAATELTTPIQYQWIPTDEIDSISRLVGLDAIWCVPASPYRSMDGALRAIRFAREGRLPFLGTCGGFQHAVIEYARNVLGWADAEHAETAPDAARAVISPLSCALVEKTGVIHFRSGSLLAAAYMSLEAVEGFHCSYGLNPAFRTLLETGPLRVSGEDIAGEVRAVELTGHPFFVGTLFQPERAALTGRLPPLVKAFIESTIRTRTKTAGS